MTNSNLKKKNIKNRIDSRLENEFNEEYDYSDRGGIVYNMDYFDESRSSSRLHYDDIPYENVEESDEAFYSTTDVIYSFPKCKFSTLFSL